MDDKRFDEIIKKKAAGFVDSGQDPNALQDFRNRMQQTRVATGTSSRWSRNTAMMVGSIALFTLINFGISWYFSHKREAASLSELADLRSEKDQLVDLKQELIELRSIKTDTVYLYRITDNASTSQAFAPSSAPNSGSYSSSFQEPYDSNESLAASDPRNHYLRLANDQQLSQELKQFLSNHNLLMTTTEGDFRLVVQDATVAPVRHSLASGVQPADRIYLPQYIPGVSVYEQFAPQSPMPEKKKLPNKMVWALEKHQHRGIDWQFGVEGMIQKSHFDVGDGSKNAGFGFMTEAILSPTWRVETGVNLGIRSYRVREDEIASLPPDFFNSYPGYDDQLGELIAMESDAELIRIPFNLKYFNILDHNKKWYVSVGATPQWAVRQEIDFKYQLDPLTPPDEDVEFVSFVGSGKEVSAAYYTTTLNLGLGTEVYLNEKFRWQLGVFYERGLSKVGVENRELTGSYGVKTSLWFNKP